MKRGETPSNVQPVDADRKYNPVFNRRHERVRGLWERNAVFYAQVNVRGWIGRVPLHEAKTLPEAQAARQVLKAQIKAGTWQTPAERAHEVQAVTKISGEKRVLKLAIEKYQESRDLLGKKDSKTCKREDSGLKCWVAFKPDLPIAAERFDQKLLLDFAEWRKRKARKSDQSLSGRAIDVNVTAMANVLNWCVVQKWLPEFPSCWHWEAMAEEPDECELLTEAQVIQLCAAAMSVKDMALTARWSQRTGFAQSRLRFFDCQSFYSTRFGQ